MNDQEFLQGFEAGTLDAFPHRSHLRMAWLYVRRDGWERGLTRVREGIQHFAAVKGANRKYHETITCFWACIVYAAFVETPHETDFDRFINAHPYLLDGLYINEFYSTAHLQSEGARREWIEPDLKPLPSQKQH